MSKQNQHPCPLTGLPNCQQLFKRLKSEITIAKVQQSPLALIMVDLDQLEEFNYEQRNKLLLQLGKLIKQSIKNTDYVARCYPANFAIILRHINLNQAYRVAQRLLDILEQQTIVFPEQKITVTASAGIAELSQDMDAVSLLRAAEAAMQHARKCGVSIL